MKRKNKKVVALLLTVVISTLILGTTVFAATPRGYDKCYVNTDGSNLNGRSGPGTEYSIVCKYANGTRLYWSVMPSENATDSEGRKWMRVKGKATSGKDTEAWVCEDYLRFERDPVPRSADVKIDASLPDVG